MNQPMTEGMREESTQPRFALKAQYIKDMSFENPHAPTSMMNLREAPRVDLNADLTAKKLQDTLYELTLRISVRAVADRTVFLTDVSHAGLFELQNIPEDKIEGLLMVDCAFMLFPYTRRIVSDITREGGFPPLMMEPIDFFQLYMDNRQPR